ncbi:hydroxysqualene dehydroxylase HpnE [Neisseria sp. Ec49-e6-T10]|uniref:hydroxysqualene dehydroxylase HpnE n=1 Tax=Neisseria sp. Ec49-e6-T10 TaxID=3140744 RepID=UPI003EBE2790
MKKPKVAIVGAGLAGLSAAVYLYDEADVTIFEAGQVAGGRTRTLPKRGQNQFLGEIDNGQHIIIGAYQSLLCLLKQVGVQETEVFLRLPLTWYIYNGLKMRCGRLPAPLNLFFAVLCSQGITIKDKYALFKSLYSLKKYQGKDNTVQRWLNHQKVPYSVQHDFWQPMVLSALNTPLEQASIHTLLKVINDGVLSSQKSSDLLLPKKTLDEVFIQPILTFLHEKKVRVCLGSRVKSIQSACHGQVLIDDQLFDSVILATAPYHAVHLIEDKDIQAKINQLQYSAICSVYLYYNQQISLPYPMVGVKDGTVDWLFDRGALGHSSNEVAAVVSCAQLEQNHGQLVKNVHQDVLKFCPYLQEPVEYQVIIEKRATFLSNVLRPKIDGRQLTQKQIYLAGDYMHSFYPATLEGAVQSGQKAAAQCLLDWKQCHE